MYSNHIVIGHSGTICISSVFKMYYICIVFVFNCEFVDCQDILCHHQNLASATPGQQLSLRILNQIRCACCLRTATTDTRNHQDVSCNERQNWEVCGVFLVCSLHIDCMCTPVFLPLFVLHLCSFTHFFCCYPVMLVWPLFGLCLGSFMIDHAILGPGRAPCVLYSLIYQIQTQYIDGGQESHLYNINHQPRQHILNDFGIQINDLPCF